MRTGILICFLVPLLAVAAEPPYEKSPFSTNRGPRFILPDGIIFSNSATAKTWTFSGSAGRTVATIEDIIGASGSIAIQGGAGNLNTLTNVTVVGSLTNASLPTNAIVRIGPGGIMTTSIIGSGLSLAADGTLSATASGGSGITNLNGLTNQSQTFTAGTSGTDFAIVSSGTNHVFNLPTASGTARGALSSADWTSFDAKQAALSFTGSGHTMRSNAPVVSQITLIGGATNSYLPTNAIVRIGPGGIMTTSIIGSGLSLAADGTLSATGGGTTPTTWTNGVLVGNVNTNNFVPTADITWQATNTSGRADLQPVLAGNIKLASIGITIDGGGQAISTGLKCWIEVPYACTIQRVTMLADQSGSAVVDIWKDTYANYPPTVADTITAAAKPTITSATKSQDSTLTGWTTSVTAGDILAFNVDSASTITKLVLQLKVTK